MFYRIHGFRLTMPALRERREDIPSLAEFFRKHFERQFGMTSQPFPAEMVEYLQNLNWNGNVRELSNGVARYVLIGLRGRRCRTKPPGGARPPKQKSINAEIVPLKSVAKDAIKEMERSVILEALRANQWNRRKTAVELKISYRALIYKIRDAGLVSGRGTAFREMPQRATPAHDALDKKAGLTS